MVVNNDCRTPDWLPRGTDQNELVNAKLEILRLTQELEAAEAKGREAGLEEAERRMAREQDYYERMATGDASTDTAVYVHFASAYQHAVDHIRALKAPAIGSQGTEKEEK